MSDNNTPSVLLMLAENEFNIGTLYTQYAKKINDKNVLWDLYAHDEFKHSKWVRSLDELAEKGLIKYNPKRINKNAIKTMANFIRDLNYQASVKCPGTLKALSNAVSIETSLLERKFFEALESDSDKFTEIVSAIHSETEKHLLEILHLFKKYQK